MDSNAEKMTTDLATTQIVTIKDKFQANLPSIQKGNEIAMSQLRELQALTIGSDEEREEAITKLAKVRAVYNKVNSMRVEITEPLDQIKDYLMSFERALDDKGKDNEYAKAKQPIAVYDQWKIDERKKAELIAENNRQIAVYKADLKAAVGRQLAEMLAGAKKNLIDGMSRWQTSLTLETFDARQKALESTPPSPIKQEKYDACFNTNFNRKPIINEEDTKIYIESLKVEYPYATYNETYIALATEIINEYRAKMPVIKKELEDIKASKDAVELEAKRKKDLEDQAARDRVQVESELTQAVQQVDEQKDMSVMEADFVKQGSTQDLEAGPMKKEASFEKDNLFLKPLLEVISVVATSGKLTSIRKRNGEYIDSVSWWLKQFETLGKEVSGIVLKDVAKVIVKEKRGE